MKFNKAFLGLMLFFVLNTSNLFALEKSWFKSFGGKIGQYPVTFNLHIANGKVSGVYYYNAKQEPIDIYGELTKKGIFNLKATLGLDIEETFELKLIDDQALKGTWIGGKKKLPVEALQKKDLPIDFTNVYSAETQTMFKGKEQPVADIFLASVWANGSSSLAKAINKGLLSFYDKKEFKEIGKYFVEAKKNFFKEFWSNKAEAEKDPNIMWTRSFDSKTEVLFISNDKLTLRNFVYEFSGGAHGNYGYSFYNFSIKNQKQLLIEDVLSAARLKEVDKLLEGKLRENYKIKANQPLTEVLFENNIKHNNNFYLTDQGIGFLYNPYEISAYAVGVIDLFIPFSDFKAK